MTAGRHILKLIGVICAAYLMVAQAALGGYGSSAHIGPAVETPFGIICLNGQNGDVENGSADHRACCTLGCLQTVAAPAPELDLVTVVYAPDVAPVRPLVEKTPAKPRVADRALTPPRAPPAIG